MRVLQLISSSGLYGAESVILNLSSALQAAGHGCGIGVFENSASPNLQLRDVAAQRGISTHTVPCNGRIDLSVVKRLRSLQRETGAEVVHTHGYKADLYAWAAFCGTGVPLVSTCHTWHKGDRAISLYAVLDRWALRSFSAVIAISQEVREQLQNAGIAPERIRMGRNGINCIPFLGCRDAEAGGFCVVGLVGRLAHEKGVDLFIRAAAQVLQSFPHTRFVVVGDGPDRAQLQQLIDRLGVSAQVTLRGRQEDMPAVYRSLTMLVSASRQEGMPVALLEAMASGLPIVATAVGETPQLIRNEETGLLIAPDDVQALALAIGTLLQDAQARYRLGSAARLLAQQEFSAEKLCSDHLELYREVSFVSR